MIQKDELDQDRKSLIRAVDTAYRYMLLVAIKKKENLQDSSCDATILEELRTSKKIIEDRYNKVIAHINQAITEIENLQ